MRLSSTSRKTSISSLYKACLVLFCLGTIVRADVFKPIMINSLFRHGARAPIWSKLDLDWPDKVGMGNLTGVGMRQQFVLGSSIKSMYPSLFDKSTFTNYDIQLRSSPTFRTIQSAISHLNGIFPSGSTSDSGFGPTVTSDDNKPNFDPLTFTFEQSTALPFGFYPFPITTDNDFLDFAFKITESCPNSLPKSKSFQKSMSGTYDGVVQDVYDNLASKGFSPQQVGFEDWNLETLSRFYDVFVADRYYTGQNRAGFSDDLYNKMEMAEGIWGTIFYSSEEIQKLWTDNITRDLVSGIESVINGTQKYKLRIWSGHDSNVLPFMMRHNLISTECLKELYQKGHTETTCEKYPQFASSFLWEVSQRDTDNAYFVRVLFNGKPIAFCKEEDNVDGFYCPFAAFKKQAQSQMYLPNFGKVCGSLYLPQSYLRYPSIILMAGVGIALIASLVLLIQTYISFRHSKERASIVAGKQIS